MANEKTYKNNETFRTRIDSSFPVTTFVGHTYKDVFFIGKLGIHKHYWWIIHKGSTYWIVNPTYQKVRTVKDAHAICDKMISFIDWDFSDPIESQKKNHDGWFNLITYVQSL